MELKGSPVNKENSISRPKSFRKSLGAQRPILNSSGLLKTSDKENINDKFTDYIDYVHAIENTNEKLKMENQSIIDSYEQNISEIKSTYGDEIDSLRKALDDISTIKMTLKLENDSLNEERNKLSTKLRNKSNSLIVLQKEFSDLEENISNYRKRVDNYENLKQDYDNLLQENDNIGTALKCEICKRAELENRLVTLNDEVEFYKKLSMNTKHSFDNAVKNNTSMTENIELKIDEEIQAIKMELNEEFELYKDELVMIYEEKFENLSKINEKSSNKCNLICSEMKCLKRKLQDTTNEVYEKDNQIAILNNRISILNDSINKTNMEHENYIKDVIDENNNLKQDLESKIIEYTEAINDKILIEKELYVFKSLLDGENSRCHIDPSTPKRRKFPRDHGDGTENKYDITKWSNDSIKMHYNYQYDGSCIVLTNDSDNDVNINEWKIEIVTGDYMDVYYFQNRVIKAGNILNVWGYTENILEDDENVVMNVQLPVADILECKLTNEMGQLEASFELKSQHGRKILKAYLKTPVQQKCNIM